MSSAQKDIVFSPLRGMWVQRKTRRNNKAVGETRLGRTIVKWVRAFLPVMSRSDTENLGGKLCDLMVEQKEIGPEDKDVCTLILRSLYAINEDGKKRCTAKRKIEDEMKEYINCTMLNLWIAIYQSKHCNKKNVVQKAFDKMKEISGTLSRGSTSRGQCGQCNYMQLEPIKILGKVPMLNFIYDMMVEDRSVMTLIRRDQGQGGCNTEKKVLTDLQLPNTIPPVAPKGSPRPRQAQPNVKGPTITEDSLTKLLKTWAGGKSIPDEEHYRKILDALKNAWEDLMKDPGKTKDETIKELCEKNLLNDGSMGTNEQAQCVTLMETYLTQDPNKSAQGNTGADASALPGPPGAGTPAAAAIPSSQPQTGSPSPSLATTTTTIQLDPCSPSAQQTQEITQSEEKRTKLKKAWEQKLQQFNGTPGQFVQGVTIPPNLKKEVDRMLNELQPYMMWEQTKKSVLSACSAFSYPREKGKEDHMKKICRVPVMIVNWMAGLDPQGNNKKDKTQEHDWETYLRCIVGDSIILRILKNKCEAQQMLKIISDTMAKGGSELQGTGANSICAWVRTEDIEKVENLIGPTLDHWLSEAGKGKNHKGGISGVNNILAWEECKDNQKQKEEQREGEKGQCKSDRIIDLLGGERWGALHKLVDPIARATSCIKDMHSNASNGNLCKYLDCMKHLWTKTDAATQKSNNNFWTKDAKALWKELFEAMKTSNGKEETQCNKMGDSSNDREATHSEKTACNYLHAGLKTLYEGTSLSTGNNGILSKKNPSLRQTMGCFLLHSYAKKMKGEATCVINAGIEKAFRAWNESTNGKCKNGSCVPCEWEEEKYDSCTIEINGANGQSTSTEKVEEKLKKVLEADNTNIEQMLTEINKMDKLCDRLQCIASHLNSSNGKQPNTSEDTFWGQNGDVQKLWGELSTAMKGKENDNGNGVCAVMGENGKTRTPTEPEKKACNYLHAGFTKLKSIGTSKGNSYSTLSKHTSFVQTMGCFLLKEYAKQIEKKSTCVIEAGLKKAFQNNNTPCTGSSSCIECKWGENLDDCKINTTNTSGSTTQTPVKDKLKTVESKMENEATNTVTKINETNSLCEKLQCAAGKWFQNQKNKAGSGTATPTKTWCEFWEDGVKPKLTKMFENISSEGQNNATKGDGVCTNFGDGNESSVERKACNHITAGLKYIKQIPNGGSGPTSPPNEQYKQLLARAVGCIALNMYADEIIKLTDKNCPIDENTIQKMFEKWNENNSCSVNGGSNNNNCFKCQREEISANCHLSVADALVEKNQNVNCNTKANEVKIKMDGLLEDGTIKMKPTLSTINKMTTFCTRLQCAAKQYHTKKNNIQSSGVNWNDMNDHIDKELKALLKQMMDTTNQEKVAKYCNDSNNNWDNGTKEGKTNKAACLLFASGLKHIYGRGRGHGNGPSFGQTMGCLFLKEYAKQLKVMAENEKKHKVHPKCSVNAGINYAFSKSKDIMKASSKCSNNNFCFECTQDDYNNCQIGNDYIGKKVEPLLKTKQTHMQQTLANTLCPILPLDLLTPFLPLAPVSIGLSVMAYYLWKYFGPLGKGGQRFRRSPADIPGSSIQEQVLDHVQQDSSHEYQLVKERKPRSAPTRTKRSGRANRRTIIEIHFEVLDECQKGDTQLAQKDFLELLVQEFMGSEFMEEEQVPKEEVLMESVPMELVPIEEVPSLGSVFMV
ncbi:SICAvar, type I [Plasmodium knowlesi strain H]|uniref:SICAvar, type I n=3 Tax=Plasmodium knowlesi TaxID=5850 RepID=A0A1A7VD37_PLAKH|nr:SICAvar, type I [Plasmodium knowlesi strain H]OTN64998.1 SICAvar type I [Plasmodium knowlesi]CAA9988470.1 SICAvar, type I [Plasmodium knowlesi strain H]SBO19774.1 SICAvar, type I [Plasmodium knowlesi strain H]SBO20470.1 SICAvar, type I [Plasmodium knowlesi strain H]VVS77944.1 SICAvar, type I [Plasmodium knowlesi strain H]